MKLSLYKYLAYDDGAKALIDNGTLKYSHFSEFNDPFDCVVSYDVEDSLEYYKSRKDLIKAVGDKLNYSPAERIQKKQQLLKNVEKSIIDGDFHKGLLNPIGICCLSKVPDSILMWSHYANHHKGVVVEFDTFQDQYTELHDVEKKLLGYPIVYQDQMPKISARNGQDGFSAVQSSILTKSLSWKYENEVRVLSTHLGPGIHNFDHSLISRIVAGVKMTHSDYLDLVERVNKTNSAKGLSIQVVKAKMSKNNYEVITT
jgi:hypothetical protein